VKKFVLWMALWIVCAGVARAQARELLIQLEGRRSTESSLTATLSRMQEQRDSQRIRCNANVGRNREACDRESPKQE